MAYILSDIVTLVQKRVKDSAYDTSEIKQYINDTQNDIFNEYRLNFMEASQAYTTTVNVADITNGAGLPTNYLVAIDMIYTSTGFIIPYVDTYDLPNTSSLSWYKYAETINLSSATTSQGVTLRYYKMPTQLILDSDIPELPYSFQEILVVGAGYRVLQAKDKYDQAGVLQNKYDEILDKLVGQTAVNQVGQSPTQRINRYPAGKRHF